MTNILLIILIVAVMIFGFWLIQYSQFRNEEKKRQWELKRESQKSVSPIRLRAYERLALLLERTTPEHMLMELNNKQPEALGAWTVPQLQQYLLQTVRMDILLQCLLIILKNILKMINVNSVLCLII